VLLTGTVEGRWGFDSFHGPTVPLQQLPGTGWHIVAPEGVEEARDLIAGHSSQLLLTSTGTACVHTISARPTGRDTDIPVPFQPDPKPDHPHLLKLTLPLEKELTPGDLHLSIQQFDQPRADEVSTRTFSEPAKVSAVELHAGDSAVVITGSRLDEIDKLVLGDLVFSQVEHDAETGSLRLALPAGTPAPSTHIDDHLSAKIVLRDGRVLAVPVVVSLPRPSIALLRKSEQPAPDSNITLGNADDLPLTSRLLFTLKSRTPFPRNGQIEIETLDGTLRTVLTLAPSGGLLLQDPHTIVATLDPLRSFGPSAFGALHLRAVYPSVQTNSAASRPESPRSGDEAERPAASSAEDTATSDWLPLVTLVREPKLTLLQCPADATQPCTVTGTDLFLTQSVSADPAFASPVEVPDGFTGTSLTVPHVNAATLFLRLRDDPGSIDTASLPTPPATPHLHATKVKPAAQAPAAVPASPAQQTSPATPPGPPA
jgi:hypothetical protein